MAKDLPNQLISRITNEFIPGKKLISMILLSRLIVIIIIARNLSPAKFVTKLLLATQRFGIIDAFTLGKLKLLLTFDQQPGLTLFRLFTIQREALQVQLVPVSIFSSNALAKT